MMKVNPQILSIPPYISTTWNNVLALSMENSTLLIDLINGKQVKIPYLTESQLEKVFLAHSQYLQKQEKKGPDLAVEGISFPLKLGTAGGLDAMGSVMQHNPDQAHIPNFPEEILRKIISVVKMVGLAADPDNFPKAEPHCNCPYCQIARALGQNLETQKETEEPVSEEDLTFRNWDIHQKGEKLYDVSNPLDTNECYQVFLGKPLGCTCGEKNCEHIKAVLNS